VTVNGGRPRFMIVTVGTLGSLGELGPVQHPPPWSEKCVRPGGRGCGPIGPSSRPGAGVALIVMREEEAKKIREKAAKKAADTDLPLIRDRNIAKARKKSDRGRAKGGRGKRKGVWTVTGGHIESNRREH